MTRAALAVAVVLAVLAIALSILRAPPITDAPAVIVLEPSPPGARPAAPGPAAPPQAPTAPPPLAPA
ncbi:MAG TPA: hypothetical protein VNT60_08670, partial [Deinococcales bacterium]|nr:hypothetical protein [Deinococcales bacterium]